MCWKVDRWSKSRVGAVRRGDNIVIEHWLEQDALLKRNGVIFKILVNRKIKKH